MSDYRYDFSPEGFRDRLAKVAIAATGFIVGVMWGAALVWWWLK